jgi:hypothetical protein
MKSKMVSALRTHKRKPEQNRTHFDGGFHWLHAAHAL